MKPFIVAGALLATIVVVAPAGAQTAAAPVEAPKPARPGSIETARKLVAVMHLDQSYDRMFKPLVSLMVSSVLPVMAKDSKLPDPVRQELGTDDGKARIGRIVGEEFIAAFRARYPQLQERTAKEYAAAFSEDDLLAIIAFYSSGPGARALALMPQLSAKLQSYGGEIGAQAGKEAYSHILDRLDTSRHT